MAGRHPFDFPNDDFVQAGNLYRKVMTDMDRDQLIGNIVKHLVGAVKRIQLRQTALFFKADADYGRRVDVAILRGPTRRRLPEPAQSLLYRDTARSAP